MSRQFTQQFLAMGSGSTSTSGPWYTGDFFLITCSFTSSGSLGPSRFTIQGSNDDGFQAPLGGTTSNNTWSLLTGVNMIGVTPGIITFGQPGFRWLRVTVEPTVNSVASATTIVFAGVSY